MKCILNIIHLAFATAFIFHCSIAYGNQGELFEAIKNGDLHQTELLIKKGADVNATNDKHDTALILAADIGNIEIVKLLIDHGADVHAKGGRAYTVARENGHNQIALILIDLIINWSTVEDDTFRSIIEGGNYILIETEFEPDLLMRLDQSQLRLLKSTIYAKYRYKFQANDLDLTEHFSRFSWYDPRYDEVEKFFTDFDRELVEYIVWMEGKTGLKPPTQEYLESLLIGEWMAGPPYYPSFTFYPDKKFKWSIPERDMAEGVKGKWKIEEKHVYVLIETAFRRWLSPDKTEEKTVDDSEWEMIADFSTYRPKIRNKPVEMELKAYEYFKTRDL
ncbi:MAG: ankyrin repeat domain-containing protein [Spirochaetota bacterium]|nr:MAG: ankyrin repeat domain-containing protein [Spirochaetota bacterium]